MPGKIHVPVTVATDGFEKIQRTFSRLKGVAIGLTAAIAGLGAAARAIDFTGAAIQGARDLERNYAGLESVFKDSTEQMKEFGRTASEMGLSMNEAAKATTFIGSVLKQSGFSIQETANLTEELVELGADLALTYGYDVQEALLGMTALFRGEYDPIEKFGVAMKQSEIDAEKAARGLDGLTGAAERFADQQIRVEFLMERASDAMGAFDRQSGNLTVQQMRLRAEFENVRDTVADDLLPPLAEFTGGLREIVEEVGPDLESMFSDLAPVLDDLGQASLPVLQTAIEGIIEFGTLLIGFLEDAMDPSTELGESFQDLGTAFGDLIGDTSGLPTMQQNFENFTGAVIELNDALADIVKTIDDVKDPFVGLFEDIGKAIESSGLSDEEAGAIGIVTTIGLLATNLERVSKVVKKIPKTGLIGLALFGAGAVGSDQNDQIERAREEINDFEGDFDDLYSQVTTSAEAFAYLELQTIKQLDAMGALTDEYIAQNPEVAALLDKVRNIAPEFNNFNNELTNGRIAANQLGLSDGLPTWLNGVKERTRQATEEMLDFKEATLQVLQLELRDLMRFGAAQEDIDALSSAIAEFMKDPTGGEAGDLGDEAGKAATDYVGEFFNGIKEGIEKEAARLDLEELGLSAALIDQILGSEGWDELFQTIIKGGEEMARQLQDDFNRTAAGIKEAEEAAKAFAEANQKIADEIEDLNRRMADAQAEYNEAVKEAKDEFAEFKDALDLNVDALQTYDREIGRFESQTRSDLSRIESQIMSAFDNGYLLEDAKNNLLEYARAELNVLMQIQQQRDQLLARRNAAADVIFGIAEATTAAGNITRLLRDVQNEITEVQVTELFEDVVKSADGLKDFKVTVERNYTDVIETTVNKSRQLVNGFQDVVNRTREFIDNLKILREMGLDPFLFNQLVEAGAEAGGATAEALVEGGKDTVMEVNSLQRELESLGVELGEQTYDVTKNSGAQFVSGIVDGMDDELSELQQAAKSIAENFGTTFAEAMNTAMENAFDGILEGIKSEFAALMSELQALLDELRNMQTNVYPTYEGQQPFMPELEGPDGPTGPRIDVPRITGPENTQPPSFTPPGPAPDPFSGYRTSGGGGGITIMNVTANNPLDAYNASKGNVLQQSTFQSANGSIEGTLSGVGS